MADSFKRKPGAKWVKLRDSLNNLIDGYGVVQGIVSGLTGSDTTMIQSACAKADTFSELGLTSLSGSMQIDKVTALPLGEGRALTTTELGPATFLPVRKKSTQIKWQTPYTMHVDRFLDAADESVVVTSGKTALTDPVGRPVKVRIPVPAAKVYALSIVSSAPSSDEADIGNFATISGYSATVLRHPNDTKMFDVDTGGNLWYDIEIHEFRADDPVNGWHIHTIGPKNEIIITDIKAI